MLRDSEVAFSNVALESSNPSLERRMSRCHRDAAVNISGEVFDAIVSVESLYQ